QPARRASASINDENLCIAGSARVEDNLLSVGRPAWSSGRGVEAGELNQATSVAPAHPDFVSAATGRFKGDLASIRRELGTTFYSCCKYESIGRTGRNRNRMELPSPDVDIRRLARVHQSVALNRRFYSFLAKLQPFWF